MASIKLSSVLITSTLFLFSAHRALGVCTISDFKTECLNQTGTNRATYFDGFCWILHPLPVAWSVAKTACVGEHSEGRLALLSNKHQLEALKSVLDLFSFVWVALERDVSYPEPNGWQYVEGGGSRAFPTALDLWAPGQPTAGGGDHAAVNHRGLANQNSGRAHPFLCQIPEPAGCPNRACFNQFNMGMKGSVAQGDIVTDTVTNVNINYCSRLCAERSKCQSLAHDRNTKTCILYWLDAKDLRLDADVDYQILNKNTIDTDCKHLSECTNDEALLLFGADTDPGQWSVESFHPDSPSSNQIEASLPLGSEVLVVAGLVGGKSVLLCTGVATNWTTPPCYFYDLTTKSFITAPSMIKGHKFAHSVVYDHHTLVVCGGKSSGRLKDCQKYSTATGDWQPIASMNLAKFQFSFAQAGRFLYTVGGRDGMTFYSQVERYDPITDAWSFVAPLPTELRLNSAATLHGFVYSCGGRDSGGILLKNCWKYSPHTDQWMPVADMINARVGHSLVAFNGKLMAVGGSADRSVESYDGATDSWTMSPVTLMVERSTAAVVVV